MKIRSGATIVFQGDSITDGDRNRDDPRDLGTGYVMMVAERFSAKYSEVDAVCALRRLNRI